MAYTNMRDFLSVILDSVDPDTGELKVSLSDETITALAEAIATAISP